MLGFKFPLLHSLLDRPRPVDFQNECRGVLNNGLTQEGRKGRVGRVDQLVHEITYLIGGLWWFCDVL